jgi:hypothetical protein
MRATDATSEKGEPKWVPVFLKHFAQCGIVSAAAKKARINRQSVYVYRERHPDFAELWRQAAAEAVEMAEAEMHRRAVVGVLKPVYQGGEKVGTIREYSDTLLIFMLKARRPAVYRDSSRVVLAGDANDPVKHEHSGTVRQQHSLGRVGARFAAALAAAAALEEGDPAGRDGAEQPVDPAGDQERTDR